MRPEATNAYWDQLTRTGSKEGIVQSVVTLEGIYLTTV